MPSSPILQAWRNTTSASGCAKCSLSCTPGLALRSTEASVALRTFERLAAQVPPVQFERPVELSQQKVRHDELEFMCTLDHQGRVGVDYEHGVRALVPHESKHLVKACKSE